MSLTTGIQKKKTRLGVILALGLVPALIGACGAPAATPTPLPTKPPVSTAPPAAKPTASGAAPVTTAPPKAAATPTVAGGAAAGGSAAGRTLFQTNCDSCHPGGKQGVGPALTGVLNKLGEDKVKDTIRKGRSGTAMPAFPEARISDAQLSDLVAFLKSL